MLEWQAIRGQSIPQVLARKSDYTVKNRAASGASFARGSDPSDPRKAIVAQYEPGSWDWVIVNGGANDLLFGCGCATCKRKLNQIISEDAKSGILPDLISRIRADGARVLIMGYYQGNARPNLFSRCERVVKELVGRQRILAKQEDGVEFMSPTPAVDPQNRSHFAFDGVHLSIRGTRRVGALLAKTLEQLDAK